MAYLSRSEILAAADIAFEDVHVPEWGGTVRVRGLTGAERDAFEASIFEQRGKRQQINMQNMRARFVAASIVDEEGKRIFAERDVEALGAKSASALQRVFEVSQRLSGLSESDVEELGKN